MKRSALFTTLALLLITSPALATDVMNLDKRSYKIKVQGEGKLSISFHKINAGGTIYGLCGYSFCSFQIGNQKIIANRGDRLRIQGGRWSKQ